MKCFIHTSAKLLEWFQQVMDASGEIRLLPVIASSLFKEGEADDILACYPKWVVIEKVLYMESTVIRDLDPAPSCNISVSVIGGDREEMYGEGLLSQQDIHDAITQGNQIYLVPVTGIETIITPNQREIVRVGCEVMAGSFIPKSVWEEKAEAAGAKTSKALFSTGSFLGTFVKQTAKSLKSFGDGFYEGTKR